MPLQNGKYVSPTWHNGGPPALDAAELQAITDTLGNQYTNSESLSDLTRTLLSLPATAVPDDAFQKLVFGPGKYGYVIHMQYEDGTPAGNVPISGLNPYISGVNKTDANGDYIGVSTRTSVTFTATSNYIDLSAFTSPEIQSTGVITNYMGTFSKRKTDAYVRIDNSGTFRFTKYVKFADFCAVGGGGNSAYYNGSAYGSGGGSGGGINNLLHVPIALSTEFTINNGAGGQYSENSGKTIIMKDGQEILTANGGLKAPYGAATAGGAEVQGGGKGGDGAPFGSTNVTGQPGGAASVDIFNDPAIGKLASGGGGGGSTTEQRAAGGAPNGSYGAGVGTNQSYVSGSIPGGGAGGRNNAGGNINSQGGAGATYVRWYDA